MSAREHIVAASVTVGLVLIAVGIELFRRAFQRPPEPFDTSPTPGGSK